MDEELKVKLESEGVNEPSLEEMPVQDSESDNHDKFMEHYQEMPLWKRGVFLALCFGAMSAVIVFINFVVDFGVEMIKAFLR